MNAEQIYPIVYIAVRKEVEENDPSPGLERYYDYGKRLPHPGEVDIETASALCTSVSHSTKVGLEAFYQAEITIAKLTELAEEYNVEMSETIKANPYLFSTEVSDYLRQSVIKLGEFVRKNFKGRRVLNDEDKRLLESI